MRTPARIALCLLFFIAATASIAQPVELTDQSPVQVIGRSLWLLEDSSSSLTIEQVASPEFLYRFTKSETAIPNFNVTRANVWSRLQLINRSQHARWYLECSNPNVRNVELYAKRGPVYGRWNSGFNVYPEDRPVKTRNILFPLYLPKDSVMTFYVKMNDVLPLQVHLSVGNSERLFERYEKLDFLHGSFFGLLLMLIIYNLFIYVSVRDKVYLLYVVFVLANGWFISFLTGYGIHISGVAGIFSRHPALVPYFLGAASCIFSIVFLDMKRTFKKGYNITVFMFFLLLTVPLLDLLGLKVESILLVQLYGLSFSIVSFVFGMIVYRRGYSSAKFYILGWTAYLAGLIVHIFTDLKVIPFTALTHNALEAGTALEAILLSMAVGDKISSFKKETERAQEHALEEARKNEQLIREQNVVLEQKVSERTLELQEQKHLVEEKNKEILDSISYARRIQYALLAQETLLEKNLPQYFVLFKPKDIVSGDFYWAAEKGDHFFLAVCDSTGHGVPGAFMSLLNISFLNEAVAEKNLRQPNQIFDHVRQRLIENISNNGGQDGMDAVLLAFDRGRRTISYASANNSLIEVHKGRLVNHPAEKMPIGKGEKNEEFSLRTLNAEPGSMLYLYTDGYADQFGGPRGKKFKYKQLDELLLSIYELGVEEQKQKLQAAFNAWKGNLEQVDDVCIIGVRI